MLTIRTLLLQEKSKSCVDNEGEGVNAAVQTVVQEPSSSTRTSSARAKKLRASIMRRGHPQAPGDERPAHKRQSHRRMPSWGQSSGGEGDDWSDLGLEEDNPREPLPAAPAGHGGDGGSRVILGELARRLKRRIENSKPRGGSEMLFDKRKGQWVGNGDALLAFGSDEVPAATRGGSSRGREGGPQGEVQCPATCAAVLQTPLSDERTRASKQAWAGAFRMSAEDMSSLQRDYKRVNQEMGAWRRDGKVPWECVAEHPHRPSAATNLCHAVEQHRADVSTRAQTLPVNPKS